MAQDEFCGVKPTLVPPTFALVLTFRVFLTVMVPSAKISSLLLPAVAKECILTPLTLNYQKSQRNMV